MITLNWLGYNVAHRRVPAKKICIKKFTQEPVYTRSDIVEYYNEVLSTALSELKYDVSIDELWNVFWHQFYRIDEFDDKFWTNKLIEVLSFILQHQNKNFHVILQDAFNRPSVSNEFYQSSISDKLFQSNIEVVVTKRPIRAPIDCMLEEPMPVGLCTDIVIYRKYDIF